MNQSQTRAQSHQRTLEQRRAAEAWQCVDAVRKTPYADEYGQLAREAASLVQMHGLGQTLAFLKAKAKEKENEHQHLARDLSRWVSRQLLGEARDDLREWIVNQATVAEYRRATLEALAFLTWLKRFAEAELVKE
ncbi:type III-B CRISPR module-associated protein Cmr5 [Thermomicrobium sp. CFH 73360]|uniref:type III-B CRISPR module-associated protein Cmr5 n=1 Tax=Thermomicrobium sp. CFH 73360 TaxID=2951987 RepID=UPI0020779183|nr:type III-B CRISPR module-associated protein Cmr5 [Thermomicrobium sp. CFH 73360]MCM8746991.1 type III-B CRISPR module-associated protein Cmr5 [Thermomicrobium sp. CFH 73360]